jgi:hypothetical protein
MLRSITLSLILVVIAFGVPVLATLIAGEAGLPARLVGWLTLVLMGVLAYSIRRFIKILLFGSRGQPAARPRRSHRRL